MPYSNQVTQATNKTYVGGNHLPIPIWAIAACVGGGVLILIILIIICFIFCKRKCCFKHRCYIPCIDGPVTDDERLHIFQKPEPSEVYEQEYPQISEEEHEQAESIVAATTIYGENKDKLSIMGQSTIEDHNKDHLIPSCGKLVAKLIYDARKSQLKYTSCECSNLPSGDRGGPEAFQLCLVIIPAKKARYRSGIVPSSNPDFNINYGLKPFPPDEIADSALRLRLYGCSRNRRQYLLGECVIGLAGLDLKKENKYTFRLEVRRGMKKAIKSASAASNAFLDSDSDEPMSSGVSLLSTAPQGNQPELFLGLAYNATTGRLAVEVIKGSCLMAPVDPMQMAGFGSVTKLPDSYVRLSVTSKAGQDLIHTKTVVRRKESNPQFRQKFMFPVPEFQLPDITLMVTVLHKKSITKKSPIGWFAVGSSSSGEEEEDHWKCMLDNKGEQVRRWHALQISGEHKHGVDFGGH